MSWDTDLTSTVLSMASTVDSPLTVMAEPGTKSFALIRRVASVTARQRPAIQKVQKELGVPKLLRFAGEGKDLAVAAGHPDDELDYLIASDPAHGSLPASLWHDNRANAVEGRASRSASSLEAMTLVGARPSRPERRAT